MSSIDNNAQPCPACGSEALVFPYWVACSSNECNFSGPETVTETDAVNVWNAIRILPNEVLKWARGE